MGNIISMGLIHNSLRIKKENKYIEDPILSTVYCSYCKKYFKNKIEYSEHLGNCINGDL